MQRKADRRDALERQFRAEFDTTVTKVSRALLASLTHMP